MQTLTLVTGNAGKLEEWKRLLPPGFVIESADIDLDEIQSLDLEAIVIDKAKRAYERIGGPVLVEDVSVGVDSLHGLPGPFIKFFEIELGLDALYQVSNKSGEPATAISTVAYYDGSKTITARGEVRGTAVAARGESGFGFDSCFVPDGSTKTYAEMTQKEKDAVSHRAAAIKELLKLL